MSEVSDFDQRSNRWVSFTDDELAALYTAVFLHEEDSVELDSIMRQMRDELARRCGQGLGVDASGKTVESKLQQALKMRAAGRT